MKKVMFVLSSTLFAAGMNGDCNGDMAMPAAQELPQGACCLSVESCVGADSDPCANVVSAEENPRPLQFTDAEYLANGIDPALPDPPNPLNPLNHPPNNYDPTKFVDPLDGVNDGGRATLQANGDIEANEITGGFNHSGSPIYYTVLAKFNEGSFTDDQAGTDAREIANLFVAYIFPKASGPQFVPMFPNRRQDNVFDTRNGYFSNNPLGLWRLGFVKWVDVEDAPDPAKCQGLRDHLEAHNGLDLDGTPIIRTLSEIEMLAANGCIKIRSRDPDGSLPDSLEPGENGGPEFAFRWVV